MTQKIELAMNRQKLERMIVIAKEQMQRLPPMPENAYSNEFVSALIARIESDKAEIERLRGLLEEYAKHAADSGWINLASEIRRRAAKGE